MPSTLKNKLAMLSRGTARRNAPLPEPELVTRVDTRPCPPGLYALSERALRLLDCDGAFDVEKCVFLDTETTGLSTGAGTVAFLVGVGHVEGGRFTVTQHLMPSYAAEPLLMSALSEHLAQAQVIVTFNGKSFDVPLLESRYVMCRMASPLVGLRHIDLLHPARRVWKLRLNSCTLSRLEECVLNAPREDDLPGSEAPERYFSFLKTGDFSLLEDVIRHNRQDIYSLGALLDCLAHVYDDPRAQPDTADLFSLGRAFERSGDAGEARALYGLAAKPRSRASLEGLKSARVEGSANERLARLLRRAGEGDEAERVLKEMVARGQNGAYPHTELAKRYEHVARDYPSALRHARMALALAEEAQKSDAERRVARLTRKMDNATGGHTK